MFGHIDRPDTYQPFVLPWPFIEALEAMKKLHFHSRAEAGRIDIRGDDLYLLLQHNETKPREQISIESHYQYADIHLCQSGSEIIDTWSSLHHLQITDSYVGEKDYMLWQERFDGVARSPLSMTPGSFAIFMPNVPHRPNVFNGNDRQVTKIVAKVKMALLQPNYLAAPRIISASCIVGLPEHGTPAELRHRFVTNRFDAIDPDCLDEAAYPLTLPRQSSLNISLVDMGRDYSIQEGKTALAAHGLVEATPIMLLALNDLYPALMDENPIVCLSHLPSRKQSGRKAFMLHKHGTWRRLRTHFAEAGFGKHVRIAGSQPV